jgi:oligoendopeptidase F
MIPPLKGTDMHPFARIALSLCGLTLATATVSVGQEKDRTKIADQYKWNLADIYPNDAAWKKAKETLTADMKKIDRYKGKLSSSAQQLLGCLESSSEIFKEYSRLSSYASMKSDEDTRESTPLAMKQEMSALGASIGAAMSFIEPEILKMSKTKITSFISSEKKLGVYKHNLDDLLRRKLHTGTEGEEKIIADAGLMADAPDNIYGIFSNADFPYPDVTLSDNSKVKLDQSTFVLQRASPNREDRKKVFTAFFGRKNDYRRTFGTQLSAEVNKDLFYMKARKYGSTLESALDANNVPVAVYHSLIENVNKNLSTFHRYLKLRKRMMGLDQLHYYDLYAPLVGGVDLKYTIEEAEQNVIASLEPLGKEYIDVTKKAFSSRWLDIYPTDGKRSGAYSNGSVYDAHPYILLNYVGKYNDMSTISHELGHTMQSYLSNKNQPYPISQYPIFVAEVASTFNEALLLEHMLQTIKDDNVRLSLLGNYLENIKGTVFRQTQFAEFELRIHEKAEKGEALTGDDFNKIYEEITRKYYGHDQGICIVDDEIKAEWAFIPHFYYNYYVYQYATAFTASAALSEKTLAGDQATTAKYLQFLSSGGSEYPIDLLKTAGVDMTTSEPFEFTMKKMNRVMDEMEKILDKTKK